MSARKRGLGRGLDALLATQSSQDVSESPTSELTSTQSDNSLKKIAN